jgi:hypothetical protein
VDGSYDRVHRDRREQPVLVVIMEQYAAQIAALYDETVA